MPGKLPVANAMERPALMLVGTGTMRRTAGIQAAVLDIPQMSSVRQRT
jgi:hypothetical protein